MPGCDCLDRINEELKLWNARLSFPLVGPRRPYLEVLKIRTKPKGDLPAVLPAYCPFCGEPYESDPRHTIIPAV